MGLSPERRIRRNEERLLKEQEVLLGRPLDKTEKDEIRGYVREIERDDDYDISERTKDSRMPFIGVAQGDTKTVRRKGKDVQIQKQGGRSELSAKRFQGMTDA